MKDMIKVRVGAGYLIATISQDDNYPGIDVEYVADSDTGENLSRPRVLIECPNNDTLRALIWNNPNKEDYSEEIELL